MDFPTKRYFRADRTPLKYGSEPTSISLDCADANEWNETGSTGGVMWDGDVPRFKTTTERRYELLPGADAQRNRITDAEILDGFEWASVKFPLTLENQSNFSQLYTLSKDNLLVYPKKVWAGLSSTELNDAAEVQEFYLEGIAHVEACLDAGFTQKQAFRSMNYVTLKKWMSDNRSV